MDSNIGQHFYEGKFYRHENFFTKKTSLEIRQHSELPKNIRLSRHKISRRYLYDAGNKVSLGDIYSGKGGKEYVRIKDRWYEIEVSESGLSIEVLK